ncbi:hypothetical protein F4X33_00080 [Candidatus Poribacteria bacterium]|nr:hypothetical protein [Candidatus Poribacteria bacterium]
MTAHSVGCGSRESFTAATTNVPQFVTQRLRAVADAFERLGYIRELAGQTQHWRSVLLDYVP